MNTNQIEGDSMSSWMLVERYVANYPHEWRIVFKRRDEMLEVAVPEEVWRAFDKAGAHA